MKKQIRRTLQSKTGTTMVEILVGFVILVLIMGIFSQAMNLTGRMVGKSNDTLTDYRNLAGGYYLENSEVVDIMESEKKSMTFTQISGDKGSFSIPVKTKTYTIKDGSGSLVEVVYETTAEATE